MMQSTPLPTEIGRVVGTERHPTTAYTFRFWARPEARLGIGSIVRVEAGDHAQVFGVVVEALAYNDVESPLHDYLSTDDYEAPTLREEIRLFEANVLRRIPEEPVGATPLGRVFLATDVDVRTALRTDDYAERLGIAAGCYGQKGSPVPVHLHRDFLLGPESGHLNITGTSGLAAKTSYILFLLKAIFAQAKAQPDIDRPGIAALLFNTKGGDLLYLDQPMLGEMNEEHRSLYTACGVDTEPFADVRYFAPYAADGYTLLTHRANYELDRVNASRPMTFGLQDIINNFEVLVGKDDVDAKAGGYLSYLRDVFVLGDGTDIGGERWPKVNSLDDLINTIKAQLGASQEDQKSSYGVHHPFTMRKVLNRLDNLRHRYGGLISQTGVSEGPLTQPLEDGVVYVVDVSKLSSQAQDLVFAAFVSQLRDRMDDPAGFGVSRLIVMVDELNKYAPSGGGDSYVATSLREVAARGRYQGLVLFGAQQFRSRVDKEVVGNAATHVFGHIESEELAQPGYSYFTPAMKEKLAALPTGEVLLKHPHFAQPIFVRFPIPPCLKGPDGLRRYPTKHRTLQEMIRDVAISKGAVTSEVEDIVANIANDNKAYQVLSSLRALREGQDVMKVLKRANLRTQLRETPKVMEEVDDPFRD